MSVQGNPSQAAAEDKKIFYNALLKVQKELGKVTKGSVNPFFRSNYADLNAHIDAVEPILNKNGFILKQPTTVINTPTGPVNLVTTVITHADTGLSEESALALPVFEDMQKLGAAITYARRYTLSSSLSMQAEDDDGNKASGKVSPKAKSKVRTISDF